jgi:hypothetical protein
MQFSDNFPPSGESNQPSRKKPIFPITEPLRNYLKHHGREGLVRMYAILKTAGTPPVPQSDYLFHPS